MYSEDGVEGRQKRRWDVKTIADVTRAVLILAVGVVLLLGSFLKIAFVLQIDSFLRYWFGGISILYGGFRLYRGVKG